MKSKVNAGTVPEATRRPSGCINDKDWFALKQRLHSVVVHPKTAEEGGAKSQLEVQSLNIVQDKDLWAQFQMEARANKISTTAGVKELLRQKQVKHHHQQVLHNERAASAGSLVPKEGSKFPLISALKPSRLSESDVSSSSTSLNRLLSRRQSTGLKTESITTKNESFELAHLQRRHSNNIFESINDDGTQDYRQAIRGNTKNLLSLYDTLNQDQKSLGLLRFPFRGKQTIMEFPDDSFVDCERDEIMSRDADAKVQCQEVFIGTSSLAATTEGNIESTRELSTDTDEQASVNNAVSDDEEEDDRSNNGCFEYPQESRQKALERSGLAAMITRRSSSLKQSTRTSSLTSDGSCLLLDWDDSSEFSDDDSN